MERHVRTIRRCFIDWYKNLSFKIINLIIIFAKPEGGYDEN